MREATAIAFVLAVLMGALAIAQLDTLRATIQASITGPLSTFVGLWPILTATLLVSAGVALIAGVARQR